MSASTNKKTEENTGFKLLAIRPLEGCDQRFRKNLKNGVIYKFYQDYSFLDDTNFEILEENRNISEEVLFVRCDANQLKDFYSDAGDPFISVSAIVGKNGSGKSSLIELLFYTIYKIGVDKHILVPKSEEYRSELEELILDKTFIRESIKLSDPDRNQYLKSQGFGSMLVLVSSLNRKYDVQPNQLQDFNNEVISNEEILQSLFDEMEKRENQLVKQIKQENKFDNLVNLYFNVEIYFEKSKSIYCIRLVDGVFEMYQGLIDDLEAYFELKKKDIDDIELRELFYTISTNYSHHSLNSSVIGNWIDCLFHKNDGYVTPLVINPMRDKGDIEINREERFAKSRLLSNVLYDSSQNDVLDYAVSDFQKVTTVSFTHDPIYWINKVYSWDTFNDGMHWERQWFENFVVQRIPNFNFERLKKIKYSENIVTYIVDKLYKIGDTYEHYKKLQKPLRTVDISNYIDRFIEVFDNDESHITFKIHQCINYLIRNCNDNRNEQWNSEANQFEFSVKELIEWCGIETKDTPIEVIRKLPPPIFDIDFNLSGNSASEPPLFGDLSSGEKQLVHSVQTVIYHLNNLESIQKNALELGRINYRSVNLIFDEIELYFHPDFQRRFLDQVLIGIKKMKLHAVNGINILFATHSPFILSDIPAQNILRLNDGKPQTFNFEETGTFGANIHDLLHNDFYLADGFMGEFAKKKINEVINLLNHEKLDRRINKLQSDIDQSPKKTTFLQKDLAELSRSKSVLAEKSNKMTINDCEKIIRMIGEPALKQALLNQYFDLFPFSEETEEEKHFREMAKKLNYDIKKRL